MKARSLLETISAGYPVVVDDDGDVPHALAAFFDEDDEAYIRFWKARGNKIVVQSIASTPEVRGREMVQWLKNTYRLPIIVVEATMEALGFWEKMQEEGLVASVEEARGYPSRWEKKSIPT